MQSAQNPLSSRPWSEPFGLFGVLESKRTILPLKGVECDFSVVSGIAEVLMTQIFRQENEKPLNCEYLFPLPADAAVYACEADINGRTIRAQVEERQIARKIAAEKKAAGYRTALVEAERENLFTLGLGNVQPGDVVVIQLKYFQTLRFLAGMPSIEVPFCPGIRYIPGKPLLRSNLGKGVIDDTDQVPDASRITPVRIDAEHPDAAYVEVRGTLDGKFVDDKELMSPSHAIEFNRIGEELRISLSDKSEVPDRDFVLRWTERNVDAVASRVWLQQKESVAYALMELRAPKQTAGERAPVDFYFLVDRSGSMAGSKWLKAAAALQSCMQVLGREDQAMITFFESNYRDFADKPLPVQAILEDEQFRGISRLGTAGGTELRPALNHVLKVAVKHSFSRPKNLILITDAQVGNEEAILELMKRMPDFPVHCFGIDVALNDSLLQALCRQQGGTFHSLNPRDDIERALTALGRTLGQPVLLNIQLSEGWDLAESSIPSLYAGQIHYVSAMSSNGKPLQLSARTASMSDVKIQFENQDAKGNAPYLHWCRSRLQRLVAEGNQSAAIALSQKSNLICPLTAFIAWDESEKVEIATQEFLQPSLECHKSSRAYYAARREVLDLPLAESMSRKARSFGRNIFIGRCASAELETSFESVIIDEETLRRHLSDLCHRAGLADWQALIKAIFDWIAAAGDAEKSARMDAVRKLYYEISLQWSRMAGVNAPGAEEQKKVIQNQIHILLRTFVEHLTPKK